MAYSSPKHLCFSPVTGYTVRADFEGGALSSDFGLHPKVCERLLEDGEQMVNPGVGLGLTPVKLQRMHGVERRRLLAD